MQFTAFREGKSIGQFTEAQLKSALASGVLLPTDTYFGEGMAGILKLSTLGRPHQSGEPEEPPSLKQSTPPMEGAMAGKGQSVGSPDWDALPSGPVPACCARCQSADIKSVPLVFKMGQTRGSMSGLSLSADVGFAVTHNISDLAEELAPPVKASGALAIFVGGFAAAAYLGFSNDNYSTFVVWSFLAAGAALAYAIFASRAFAKSMYLWRNRWICLKCGQKFLSVAPAALGAFKQED